GTGAAPVIAETARRKGVLTVGVVTKPFLFEGTRRMRAADAGIEELQKHVDTLIVIPNQNLFLIAKAETTFKEAFLLADEVLQQGVRSITDLMVMPGLINLDFADVRSVMMEAGKAMMGTGEGEGENRALEAAERAIANPLLDGVSMAGAKGVIISIIGGEDMKLLEVDEAANHIRELVDEDANIIWGSAFNPDLQGKIRVSVVATGIDAMGQPVGADNRSFSLGASRAPKRPILELPAEDEAPAEEPATYSPPPAPEPAAEPEPLDLGTMIEPEADEAAEGAGTGSAGYAYGEDEDYDDVEGIVDPLAGLRNEPADEFGAGANADDDEDDWGDAAPGRPVKQPLDLGGMAEDDVEPQRRTGQDELLLDADRLAEQDSPLQSKTGRRRGLVSGGGGGGGGGASNAGSTLFERMANLSRGASPSSDADDEDDEDGEGSASLSIPRFLGRQNNQ
ncbi:MAG: cell division protein FtsZ, partial [Tsuneonella sp.]